MYTDSAPNLGKEWRRLHVLHHPMFRKEVDGCLWTAPVDRLHKRIMRSIVLRQGSYIEEATGEGKTCAMNLIAPRLPVDMPNLATISYREATNQFPSVRSFFKSFLIELGDQKLNGETYDIRNRVRQKLQEIALQSPWGMVWLWIDEAQAVSDPEFLFLRDIQNDLRSVHADLVVFLSGEAPNLERRLGSIKEEERFCIRQRFAARRLSLEGYKLPDVKDFFNKIDNAIWPIDSGITWTQFFFPEAFASGFRLIDEATKCMIALQDTKMLRSGEYCQIRFLKNVVACFCHVNADHDASIFNGTSDSWRNAALEAAELVHGH